MATDNFVYIVMTTRTSKRLFSSLIARGGTRHRCKKTIGKADYVIILFIYFNFLTKILSCDFITKIFFFTLFFYVRMYEYKKLVFFYKLFDMKPKK